MKFFPIYDGGYLISSRHPIQRIAATSPGRRVSLKGFAAILGRSIEYNRFRLLRPFVIFPFFLRRIISTRSDRSEREHRSAREPRSAYQFDGYFSGREGEFDPAWIHTRMSLISRLVFTVSSKHRIFKKRRKNYRILLAALSDLHECRPVYPEIPDTVAPYVFPLLVDQPQRFFPCLKQQGVPISRFGEYLWKGFDHSICPTAVKLSRGVMQFPCHQELTREELSWMIEKIREVVLNAAADPSNAG